jgi:hypothetical protein
MGVQGWVGPPRRSRPKRSGGGQAVRVDWAEMVGRANLDARLKQRKNFFLNFKLNFGIWQGFEFCTRRFRRNLDMEIFPKIF